MKINIKTFLAGREVSRADVLEWERRRARVVLKQLGCPAIEGESLASMRQRLMERKTALGTEGLCALLRRELVCAEYGSRAVAWMSAGYRRFSVTELLTDAGTPEQFVEWFDECARRNDETAMMAACPDHFLIRTLSNGGHDVIETTGGAPFAGRFTIDYQDLSSLRSPVDPSYPHQIAGVARLANGQALGGIRHQFRAEGSGFRARLLVEFPALIFPGAIPGHQWHLACEFSNWIEAAFA